MRSKVVKGRRYYQVVEGVRVGGRVKQIIHAPLGTTPDPKVALENMKQTLAELEERVESGQAAERIDREQGRIESRAIKLRIQIDHLAGSSRRRSSGCRRAGAPSARS